LWNSIEKCWFQQYAPSRMRSCAHSENVRQHLTQVPASKISHGNRQGFSSSPPLLQVLTSGLRHTFIPSIYSFYDLSFQVFIKEVLEAWGHDKNITVHDQVRKAFQPFEVQEVRLLNNIKKEECLPLSLSYYIINIIENKCWEQMICNSYDSRSVQRLRCHD
jgi:hypothetical protein